MSIFDTGSDRGKVEELEARVRELESDLAAAKEELKLVKEENTRLSAEWQQCHDVNNQYVSEHIHLSAEIASLRARDEGSGKVCPHLTKDEHGVESCWARDTVKAYRARESLRARDEERPGVLDLANEWKNRADDAGRLSRAVLAAVDAEKGVK